MKPVWNGSEGIFTALQVHYAQKLACAKLHFVSIRHVASTTIHIAAARRNNDSEWLDFSTFFVGPDAHCLRNVA